VTNAVALKVKSVLDALRHVPKIPFAVVILFVLNGIFAPLITPCDPEQTALSDKFLPPFFMPGGSVAHLLGTDRLGMDVLSRVMYGGRISLFIAFLAIVAGGLLGSLLGVLAGYYGRKTDKVIMSLSDASLAFPSILLALLLSISIGSGAAAAIISISFLMWSKYTRTIKTEVVTLKRKNFVTASKLMGASDFFVIKRHILPNVGNVIIVMVSIEVGMAILSESALSFLGLSVSPPTPSWGQMISDGNKYFLKAWWISVFPAIATAVTVLAFILLGEWMKKSLGARDE
jgi:peptide/nickel transport system permease protein